MRVLNNLFIPLLVPSLHEQSLIRTAYSLVRAERVGDPVLLFFAAFARYVASQASDIEEMDRCLDITASLAERLEQPMLSWSNAAYRTTCALIDGDIDRAEVLATDALRIGIDSGQPDASLFFGTHLIGVNQRRGTLGELSSLLEQMAAEAPTVAPALTAVRALAHAEADRVEDAGRLLEELATTGFELPLDSVWLTTVVEYSDAAIEVQDPKYARPLFDLLVPWAGQFVTIGMAGAEGPVSHYLGGLAAVLGRYGEADTYFAHAAAVNLRAGAKFFAARTDLSAGAGCSQNGTHPVTPRRLGTFSLRRTSQPWSMGTGPWSDVPPRLSTTWTELRGLSPECWTCRVATARNVPFHQAISMLDAWHRCRWGTAPSWSRKGTSCDGLRCLLVPERSTKAPDAGHRARSSG